MRRVTCRFEDRSTFLQHYRCAEGTDRDVPSIRFVATSGLHPGELVRMAIRVRDVGESHTLHMRIEARKPTLRGSDDGVRWWYRAVPTGDDAPWLEMLAEKFETAKRLSNTTG